MKTTINEWDFMDAFAKHDRDYYSYEAYQALYDYYTSIEDDTGEEMELDVIAICCDWTEYGPGELVEAYGYMVERTEWDDENAGLYDDEAERDEAYLNDLRAELEQQTTIIELDATCLVMDF